MVLIINCFRPMTDIPEKRQAIPNIREIKVTQSVK